MVSKVNLPMELFDIISSEQQKALFILLVLSSKHPKSLLETDQFEDSLLDTLRSSLECLSNEFTSDS